MIVAVSNASFRNNSDISSQLGHIVAITDYTRRANILSFGNHKLGRVVRSVTGDGKYAFADSFDVVFTLYDELFHVFRR